MENPKTKTLKTMKNIRTGKRKENCNVLLWLIKESGYEAQLSPLFYVSVTVFTLEGAQTTIGFEFCMSN